MKSKMSADGCGFIFRQGVYCSFEKIQSLESNTTDKTSLWEKQSNFGKNLKSSICKKGFQLEFPVK